MTLTTCLLVAAVVWTVSMIGSVRLRAFVYSLPIPMTIVLALTPVAVDGAQLLGVALLTLFFGVVALLHHRYRWNIVVADAAGVALYVVAGAGVSRAGDWPLAPTLAAVLAGWIAVNVAIRLTREEADPSPRTTGRGGSAGVKLVLALAGSLLTTALGRALGGLVVTFPYSGILVAAESRADLPEFAREFARNSLGLVAFIVGYAALRPAGPGAALAGAWAAFAACALLLNAGRLRRSGELRESRP